MVSPTFVTCPSLPSLEEYTDELRDIWESRWLTNSGEKHRALQAALQDYFDVSGLRLVVNGHMALEIVLQAMRLQGEVITTPYTFASTTHAIVRSGLIPVFCDIRRCDLTIDPEKVEAAVTERTSAILAVHVYGNPCDDEKLQAICRRHGLKLIYDAAHAFGVRSNGRFVLTMGDASCVSFHATKIFHTVEGGAICVNNADAALDERIRCITNFGLEDAESVTEIGTNAKMNEFCAAMGLCNLRHIAHQIAARKEIATVYDQAFSDVSGLCVPLPQKGLERNYAYYPILIDPKRFGVNRDVLLEKLRAQGILARKYFYPLTSEFAVYQDRFCPRETPVAFEASRQVLSLPIYAGLDRAVVDRIIEIVLSASSGASA